MWTDHKSLQIIEHKHCDDAGLDEGTRKNKVVKESGQEMRERDNTRFRCDTNHVLKQGVDLALALRHFGHSGCVESSELGKSL